MELEIIMPNYISQTQKDKYHIFSHMWVLDFLKRYKSRRGTVWEEKGGPQERGRRKERVMG
jgi:hypothetical protein